MIIGGLDIATKTGAAVMKDGVITAETLAYKSGKKKSILDDARKNELDAKELGQVFDWFERAITVWFIENRIEAVAIEEPLRTDFSRTKTIVDTSSAWAGQAIRKEKQAGTNLKTIFKIHGLEAVACRVAAQLNIPAYFVNQSTWGKAFTGSGAPAGRKDRAVAQCKRLGIKITSVDAAESAGICWWLNGHLNPYGARAESLFNLAPTVRPTAEAARAEAEKLFKTAG